MVLIQDDCFSGEEPATGSDAPCRKCVRGTYRTQGKDDNCQPCPTGNTTLGNGSTSAADCYIIICPLGQFWDENNRKCVQCDIGYFQDVLLATSCKSCPVNYSTRSPQANNITLCEFFCRAGYENVNGTCIPCRRGFYKDNSILDAHWGPCVICSDKNRTTDMEGSTNNSSCVIPRCNAGQYVTANKTCGDCPVDTYQPLNEPNSSISCIPCPDMTGTQSIKSKYQTDCIRDCPKGTFIRGGDCIPCPYAMYQDLPRQNSCIECGTNFNTSITGAVSRNDCTTLCVAGEQFNNSTGKCDKCPHGFYKAANENIQNLEIIQCVPCPTGKTTVTTGSSSLDDCKLEVMQDPPGLPIGPIAGGVASGAMVAVVCIILVIIFIRRRNLRNKEDAVCLGGQQFDNATHKCVPCPMGNYTTSGDGQISNTSCNISTPIELQESSYDTVEYDELHLYTDNEEEHAYKSYQKGTPIELQERSSDTVEYYELHLYTDNEEEHAIKSYQKGENCVYENTSL